MTVTGTGAEPAFAPRRKYRRSARRAWAPIAVAGIAACLLLIFVALWYARDRRQRLEDETVEALLVANRAASASQQSLFWIARNIPDGAPAEVAADRDELHRRSDQLDRELSLKWGFDRPGLASLNEPRAAAFDSLRRETKSATDRRLEESLSAAMLETAETGDGARSRIYQKHALRARSAIAKDVERLEATFRAAPR